MFTHAHLMPVFTVELIGGIFGHVDMEAQPQRVGFGYSALDRFSAERERRMQTE
jgi:hypothetical protein